MKATIVDLRYRMKEVLKALDRNEEISILYHGRTKGVLTAPPAPRGCHVADHPFFNLRQDKRTVDQEMDELRGGRHRDL